MSSQHDMLVVFLPLKYQKNKHKQTRYILLCVNLKLQNLAKFDTKQLVINEESIDIF